MYFFDHVVFFHTDHYVNHNYLKWWQECYLWNGTYIPKAVTYIVYEFFSHFEKKILQSLTFEFFFILANFCFGWPLEKCSTCAYPSTPKVKENCDIKIINGCLQIQSSSYVRNHATKVWTTCSGWPLQPHWIHNFFKTCCNVHNSHGLKPKA